MSKVTFEFNLPEEAEDFEVFAKAMQTACDIDSFRHFLRNKYKHGEFDEETFKHVEEIYDYFCELFPMR